MKLRGLTISELLVVFFIIGLLVAAATPSARRMYQESRLDRRTEEVVSIFRQARQYAVTEQSIYGVSLYQTTNHLDLIHQIPDPNNPGLYLDDIVSSLDIEQPLAVVATSLSEGELVYFNNIGNPSKAVEIILEDDFNRSRAVCINAVGSIQQKIGNSCN